jgi:hypothetical protein
MESVANTLSIYFLIISSNNRMKSIKHIIVTVILAGISFVMNAQDVMLQGFYWNYPTLYGIQRYAQNLQGRIPDMKEAGFTYLWLPPLSRAAGGRSSTGYDVMDYYDLGEYGQGATKFGTRADVNKTITMLHANGIGAVADIIYNQRAGGTYEINNAVKGWIENYNSGSVSSGNNPYPSDRFRAYILLGDTSHHNAGTYYVKVRSASQSSNFYNFPYTLAMWTHKVAVNPDSTNDSWEYEPNNGGECGDSSNFYILGTRKYAHIDAGGCGIDEFRLSLDTSMFYAAGDTLFITITNDNPTSLAAFSDQYIHNIYYDSLGINIPHSAIQYETNTDFTHMPSGKGPMNWSNFKPNGAPTTLNGDWDEMLFYYDIDQNVASTQSMFTNYVEWMFDSVKIDGMRMDAVKNYTYTAVSQILDTLNQNNHHPGMVVGEFYDYNPSSLTGFISNVKSGMSTGANATINMRVFDFALRGALKSACDQFGYDVRNMFTAGIVNGVGGAAANSVTFVNNHDFRDPGQPVTNNPELVYAYILTNNFLGIPCVFYSDFFGTNFMRGRIKGLMHANQKYIKGSTSISYLSGFNSSYSQYFVNNQFQSTTAIYQQQNYLTNENVIVAINFAGDSLDVYQQVNMANLAVGDTFTDIFGVSPSPALHTITGNNELHVKLPPRSFTIYVKGNHTDSAGLVSLGDTLAPVVVPTAIQSVGKETTEFARIYPNPFSSMIMVSMASTVDEMVAAQITDVTGRLIYSDSGITQNGKLILNPGIENAGIYFLKLSTGDQSATYKIVKQ